MQLTPRQASKLLEVDEPTLRRWIETRQLPVHYAQERPYIHPVELWEWAVEQGIPVPHALIDMARRKPEEAPGLSALLAIGGIHLDVDGDDKASVLTAITARLPLPPEINREALVAMLEAREALGSTGIGDGIAIPHVRNPIVLHLDQPFVSLFLLRHTIDFDAIDQVPVRALFVVVSPTIPLHLRILAQLGQVLHDVRLRSLLQTSTSANEVLEQIRMAETAASDRHQSRVGRGA